MKNENTDTLNRAIHSAMGGCYEYVRIDRGLDTFCGNCDKPWRDCDANSIKPNYTIPGQPLEDAKAWAVERFGEIEFCKAIGENIGYFRGVVAIATLPALDMANIIYSLILEKDG